MSPVAKAGTAGLALVAAPLLPVCVPSPVTWAVYFVAVLLLLLTITDSCHDQYTAGFRAGERAHRLSTMAEVIRLPRRSHTHFDQDAS